MEKRILTIVVALIPTVFGAAVEASAQVEGDTIEKWRQPAVKTDQPSTLSRRKLLAIVETARKRIKDLQVTFHTVTVNPSAKMVTRARTTVVTKGPRTYIDEHYSFDPNAPVYQLRRIAAFNGKRSTLYQPQNTSASVEDTRHRETETQGHRFFDLNFLNRPKESRDYGRGRGLIERAILTRNGRGNDDHSLLSLLANSGSKVRPVLEKIGDRSCHVVDCGSVTVWLDAERGCVPLRQIFHDERNPKQTMLVFLVRKVHEVSPGFWVATRGRKFNILTPGAAELTGTNEKIVLVQGWESDKPAIRVNAGVPDGFFDLWKNLPPGTSLSDRDKNQSRIVFRGADPEKK